jgi:FkbM family methyltransferase
MPNLGLVFQDRRVGMLPSQLEGSARESEVAEGSARHGQFKRTRWLVGLGLAVLATAAVLYWYGGRWMRKAQFGLTGAIVSKLGHTYYVQPRDKTITPVLLDWGIWERSESQEITESLRPGDTFIDAGADFGWYTVIGANAVGPRGSVIAFEPVPENLEYLRRNVAANGCNNVKVEPVALSNKPGKLTFHLDQTNLGDHSMLESRDRGGGTIEVEATTLDAYLKDNSGKIALMKIDTQGAEGYIIDGMAETLARHPEMALLIEYTPSALRQTGYDPEDFLRKFHQQGYEIRYFNVDPGRWRRGSNWQRTLPVVESQIASFARGTESSSDGYVNLILRRRRSE